MRRRALVLSFRGPPEGPGVVACVSLLPWFEARTAPPPRFLVAGPPSELEGKGGFASGGGVRRGRTPTWTPALLPDRDRWDLGFPSGGRVQRGRSPLWWGLGGPPQPLFRSGSRQGSGRMSGAGERRGRAPTSTKPDDRSAALNDVDTAWTEPAVYPDLEVYRPRRNRRRKRSS